MQYALCPHCLSSLQITEKQLTLKEGLIRCGHCDKVFNAYNNPLVQQQSDYLEAVEISTAEQVVADEPAAPWETSDSTRTDKKRPYTLVAFILSLLLITQAVYINAPLISQNINLQRALKLLNSTFHSQIPLYKDLDKIRIIERELSNHPSSDQALVLQLSIKNMAVVEQAYPHIALVLSSNDGNPLAYIEFKPRDYLDPQQTLLLFKAGTIQQIELSFEKPKAEVSGFEISFSH